MAEATQKERPILIDGMGRTIVNLRISVTDRCNFRCTYCMPADNVEFMDRGELLSFEEITQVARVVSKMGIYRLRLTGGEPLLRKNLPTLIQMLDGLEGIEDIAMTTNAFFLKDQAQALKDAGLRRLNTWIRRNSRTSTGATACNRCWTAWPQPARSDSNPSKLMRSP